MKRITEALDGDRYFSVEFFPPKTSKGVENLVMRAKRLETAGARFISVTWGAGGTSAEASLALARRLGEELNVPVLLHITCTNMDQQLLESTLASAKQFGLCNILALRGDPPRNDYAYSSDFNNAADLVAWIRAKYGDYFCIGVAGYPEGHAQGSCMDHSVTKDLPFLIKKVRNGADFIITQLFYDANKYLDYEKKLRAHPTGLFKNIPIIPGLMPINTYKTLMRSAKLSSATIPTNIIDKLNSLPVQDDEQVKEAGVGILCDLIEELYRGGVHGVHFYTLNLEKSVLAIVQRAHLGHEQVQIQAWDDFTNGRYTDPDSAAFGELDGYGPVVHGAVDGKPNPSWGPLESTRDISNLLVRHITNELDSTPFVDSPLNAETSLIQEELIALNERDMWTLASQPPVNGVLSTNKMFGWGPENGRIYQYPFVELLLSKSAWDKLHLQNSDPELVYYAVDPSGIVETNSSKDEKIVVTWGEWNGATQSSTIITCESCNAWGQELFEILINWRNLYKKESASWKLMDTAAQDRVFVTLIYKNTRKEFSVFDSILSSV